jgi:hypothetical protein
MVINCEHVWREISDYIEGQVDPELRAAMEAHFKECKHCTAVLDGTQNVLKLYGDDRVFELPAGFDERLRFRLAQEVRNSKPRSGRVWMLAMAACALFAGGYAVARVTSPERPVLSQQAQPAVNIPPDLVVNVADGGKLFHVPGCSVLHEKENGTPRTMQAQQAIREGYAPCLRCLRKYTLQGASNWGIDEQDGVAVGEAEDVTGQPTP